MGMTLDCHTTGTTIMVALLVVSGELAAHGIGNTMLNWPIFVFAVRSDAPSRWLLVPMSLPQSTLYRDFRRHRQPASARWKATALNQNTTRSSSNQHRPIRPSLQQHVFPRAFTSCATSSLLPRTKTQLTRQQRHQNQTRCRRCGTT